MRRKLAVIAALLLIAGCDKPPATEGGAPTLRRLTETQYRHIVADVFGPEIGVAGGFDPLPRMGGLRAVGASQAAINPSGYEQFEAMGRSIAAQAMDKKHRDYLVPCKPAAVTSADDTCARQFLSTAGRLLFRRPLSDAELGRFVTVANRAAKELGDFYDGLAMALSTQLIAPDFLYVSDTTEPDPDRAGARRLTGFAKASRLSFFLWNSGPDDLLLTAAAKGELHSASGLRGQVDRMLASPRLETGLRAFFSDMLAFDGVEQIGKDPLIYPAFKPILVGEAQEQTLRTIVDHLLTKHASYPDLFTTRQTFMTRELALLYRLPVAAPDQVWVPYAFTPEDNRAGIVTQIGFLAAHSHPGRSSATLRGKAIRELLLCQKVPDPPADVNFTLVQETDHPRLRTARARLTAHATSPTCAGCHKVIDPIGLTLEHFDGAGQYRGLENGTAIDVTGELDGKAFNGAVELGAALRDDPAAGRCVVERLFTYGVGRAAGAGDRAWLEYTAEHFSKEGSRVDKLLRRIATGDAFYAIAPPPVQGASLNGGQP